MLVILAMKIFALFCNKMLYNCKTILYTSRAIHLKTTFYRGIKMIKKLTNLIVFIALGVSFGYLFAVALTMTN